MQSGRKEGGRELEQGEGREERRSREVRGHGGERERKRHRDTRKTVLVLFTKSSTAASAHGRYCHPVRGCLLCRPLASSAGRLAPA